MIARITFATTRRASASPRHRQAPARCGLSRRTPNSTAPTAAKPTNTSTTGRDDGVSAKYAAANSVIPAAYQKDTRATPTSVEAQTLRRAESPASPSQAGPSRASDTGRSNRSIITGVSSLNGLSTLACQLLAVDPMPPRQCLIALVAGLLLASARLPGPSTRSGVERGGPAKIRRGCVRRYDGAVSCAEP
jgi:hypothetical protein